MYNRLFNLLHITVLLFTLTPFFSHAKTSEEEDCLIRPPIAIHPTMKEQEQDELAEDVPEVEPHRAAYLLKKHPVFRDRNVLELFTPYIVFNGDLCAWAGTCTQLYEAYFPRVHAHLKNITLAQPENIRNSGLKVYIRKIIEDDKALYPQTPHRLIRLSHLTDILRPLTEFDGDSNLQAPLTPQSDIVRQAFTELVKAFNQFDGCETRPLHRWVLRESHIFLRYRPNWQWACEHFTRFVKEHESADEILSSRWLVHQFAMTPLNYTRSMPSDSTYPDTMSAYAKGVGTSLKKAIAFREIVTNCRWVDPRVAGWTAVDILGFTRECLLDRTCTQLQGLSKITKTFNLKRSSVEFFSELLSLPEQKLSRLANQLLPHFCFRQNTRVHDDFVPVDDEFIKTCIEIPLEDYDLLCKIPPDEKLFKAATNSPAVNRKTLAIFYEATNTLPPSEGEVFEILSAPTPMIELWTGYDKQQFNNFREDHFDIYQRWDLATNRLVTLPLYLKLTQTDVPEFLELASHILNLLKHSYHYSHENLEIYTRHLEGPDEEMKPLAQVANIIVKNPEGRTLSHKVFDTCFMDYKKLGAQLLEVAPCLLTDIMTQSECINILDSYVSIFKQLDARKRKKYNEAVISSITATMDIKARIRKLQTLRWGIN